MRMKTSRVWLGYIVLVVAVSNCGASMLAKDEQTNQIVIDNVDDGAIIYTSEDVENISDQIDGLYLKTLRYVDNSELIRESHESWRNSVEKRCSEKDCLIEAYAARFEFLKSLSKETLNEAMNVSYKPIEARRYNYRLEKGRDEKMCKDLIDQISGVVRSEYPASGVFQPPQLEVENALLKRLDWKRVENKSDQIKQLKKGIQRIEILRNGKAAAQKFIDDKLKKLDRWTSEGSSIFSYEFDVFGNGRPETILKVEGSNEYSRILFSHGSSCNAGRRYYLIDNEFVVDAPNNDVRGKPEQLLTGCNELFRYNGKIYQSYWVKTSEDIVSKSKNFGHLMIYPIEFAPVAKCEISIN